MGKQKKSKLPPEGFKPLDVSELSDEWVLSDYVMEKLQCSVNTYKDYVDQKLLPVGKLGARKFHNKADLQHLMITLRRLSLILIPPVQLFIDWLEILGINNADM